MSGEGTKIYVLNISKIYVLKISSVKYAPHSAFDSAFDLIQTKTIELHPDVNISSYSSGVPLLNNFNIKTQFSPVLYIGILSNTHMLHRI